MVKMLLLVSKLPLSRQLSSSFETTLRGCFKKVSRLMGSISGQKNPDFRRKNPDEVKKP